MSDNDKVTVLPDGSAFAVGSFPLPKDHWLYAPRGEWDNERDDFAETPRPILTNAQRDAVIAAARYAIRGATMCGQEQDFDPDAMALNFAYAMCGPARGRVLPVDAAQQEAQEQQEALMWVELRKDGSIRSRSDSAPSQESLEIAAFEGCRWTPLYATPPRAVEPMSALTDAEVTAMVDDLIRSVAFNRGVAVEIGIRVIRAYEAALGIGKQGQG